MPRTLINLTKVGRCYHFESAHFLPKVPDGHRCKGMHGHNYEMEVVVGGKLDDVGFVIDFFELDAVVQHIVEGIDHQVLNTIDGLENPTVENIAAWMFDAIDDRLQSSWHKNKGRFLSRVRVYETKTCWAEVE